MSLGRDWVAASWDLAVEFSADERAATIFAASIVGLLCLRIATQV
jgi:hypothetical protein